MQLDREEIIKALELCKTPAASDCNACGYKGKGIKNGIYVGCTNRLIADALSIIKELTEENESLKQAMEHEHASFMEIFGQYGEKCDRLTEENANLHASCMEFER
jgi:hypothetical protein